MRSVRAKRRIVVALDTGSLSRTAIEAAAGLAAGLSAEVVAMYVEDVKLLHLAGLPFARELGGASATSRRLQAADMERALAAQAKQLRRALEETAKRLPFSWSLEIVRGDLLEIALEQAEADLLVLGRTRRPGYAGPGERRAPVRPLPLIGARRIVAVFDESLAGMRTLEAAFALAQTAHAALVVVVRTAHPERSKALREQARAWLAERGAAAASYGSIAAHDTALMGHMALLHGAAAVLLPEPERQAEAEDLARLIDDIACPVVLIR